MLQVQSVMLELLLHLRSTCWLCSHIAWFTMHHSFLIDLGQRIAITLHLLQSHCIIQGGERHPLAVLHRLLLQLLLLGLTLALLTKRHCEEGS